ncbi:MAG: hypothetical protein U1F43_29010 [Myxococcota bacterium]
MLILRDVVGFEASECASLLDLSLAAVNSALQRARDAGAAPAAERRGGAAAAPGALHGRLAARRSERAGGAPARGRDAGHAAARELAPRRRRHPPLCWRPWCSGLAAVGRFRLVATAANGAPACAAYARGADGAWALQALHVLDVRDGVIAGIVAFLDPRSFAGLGLPATLSDVTL